ncbi:MAG: NAD+ synthase [Myxococcales bacterium]|nr:NAD+ synthase [Myxococcales bacterium]MCB9651661.1 NAD+ synthase [Deltaproteobacteria bacterium]
MKIALVQINTTVGALDDNAALILDGARRAREAGADLALFPELALPGYPPQDLLERPPFIDACARAEASLVEQLPEGLVAVFGNIRPRPVPPTCGRALQNVAVVARRGQVLHHVVKALLPTYDVFDEARYFEPADEGEAVVVELAGKRVGISICEDIWNDDELWQSEDLWRDKSPGHHRLYDHDPVLALAEKDMEVLVNISASPWAQGKLSVRKKVLAHAARRHGVWVAYVNLLGANDGLVFDGQSMLLRPDGALAGELPAWVPEVGVFEIGPDAPAVEPRPAPRQIEKIRDALTLGIRDYFTKSRLTKAAVGLSGGIDSAVTAYLAVRALGPENVIGVGMPSQYSSDHSIADARALAENLGIRFELLPIADVFGAFMGVLSAPFAGLPADVTEENLQSRIRGVLLMAMANKLGAVVLSTGNKSEASMGYATLYGDTVGAICVLADLYKHQVYGMAHLANEGGVVIPESSITKPPSAELRPGQKDTDSLPPYEQLDAMLEMFIEHRATAAEMAEKAGAPLALAEKIVRTVYLNEFKRKQMPPTLRVSRKSWVGRVYPIVQRFRE